MVLLLAEEQSNGRKRDGKAERGHTHLNPKGTSHQ